MIRIKKYEWSQGFFLNCLPCVDVTLTIYICICVSLGENQN